MKGFKENSKVGVYGNQSDAIQAMIDYDFYTGKSQTCIVWAVDPTLSSSTNAMYFWGTEEISIPLYPTLKEAVKTTSADILINFASSRSAFLVSKEVLETDISSVVVIAEGVPEREARILRSIAKKEDKYVLGPATVGGLVGGILKIGNAGGTIENIVENRLYQRGSVGIVSKSGGMLNELMTIVSRQTDGICEAIAVGGDRFPSTTLLDQVILFEKNPDVKMIVMLGEIGGTQEIELAEMVKAKKIKKPIVAWISGVGAKNLKKQIQFGHAGAKANSESETSESKLKVLKEAGVNVPSTYIELENTIRKVAKKLSIENKGSEPLLPPLPLSFDALMRQKKIRYRKQFVTSISKKIGQDESYLGCSIYETAANKSIGDLLGLLWFKHEFRPEISEIFEIFIKLTADHGAQVSGAHNTIIASRAGKDLVSSLVSGLLTIGPRFGGAVNDSAKYLKWGFDTALPPFGFVEEMKNKGLLIPGIGHKVKSKTNPDKRVQLITEKAKKALKEHKYLDYALEIEKVTTRKKDSLILNVDGAMAAVLLDILSEEFTSEEIDTYIKMEALNAFFVFARSMGLIAHFIDQKRLDQDLYRVPDWDILEVD